MADMEKDSVKVTFSKSKEAYVEADEVDKEEYSGSYPGKVFNVFYRGCNNVDVSSDVGNVRKLQTGVPIHKTELLEFVNEKEADLQYEPSGSVNQKYSTVGSNWSRNGRRIKFSEKKTGLLQLSYSTTCERWGFNFTFAEQFCNNGKPPAALIIFRCASEMDSEVVENWYCHKKDVSIKVVDACTGDPVPGASVTIGGKKEVADEDGNVTFADIAEGEKSVKITAEGYIDSDKDPLDNDSINVEYDEDEDDRFYDKEEAKEYAQKEAFRVLAHVKHYDKLKRGSYKYIASYYDISNSSVSSKMNKALIALGYKEKKKEKGSQTTQNLNKKEAREKQGITI